MHELKTGLYADKFATFWMFPKSFITHSFCKRSKRCGRKFQDLSMICLPKNLNDQAVSWQLVVSLRLQL